MALPMSEDVSDMHCVTQWSRYDNHWKGVSARALLDIVRPSAEVNHVIFTAYDGYTTNIRLDQFDQPDVFLVHQWEGKPITPRAWRSGPHAGAPGCIFGNQPSGCGASTSPSATIPASGRSAATTTTAIRGWRNVMVDLARRTILAITGGALLMAADKDQLAWKFEFPIDRGRHRLDLGELQGARPAGGQHRQFLRLHVSI